MDHRSTSEHFNAKPLFTFRDVAFPATLADIATPFFLFRNNLRRPSAVADRIAKRHGKAKLVLIQCLASLIYLLCKGIYRLLGVEFARTLRLFEGLEPAQYVDPFGYRSQGITYHFDHDTPPKAAESVQPITRGGSNQ